MVSQTQPTLVAVIGIGLVGAEFVDQLLAQPKERFQIVSLSTSRVTLFNASGLDLSSNWRSVFQQTNAPTILSALLGELRALVEAGRKVVLVDNTSAENVANMYPNFLAAGVNVITPNKKAFSGEQKLFEDILAASEKSSARFLNESTVGAGLPIISTLKDLVGTGDEVTKIEGVFSGTMSYIFNNFSTSASGGPAFSSVVNVARDSGYTEPHPGDDLNGADVARKLTILSRTIPALRSALPEGYKSVETRSLVPKAIDGLATGSEFMSRLPEFDTEFDTLRAEAQKEGKVLRYVGVIDVEKGVIKASLEKYENTHAFATSLGGSDNIIMFHTKRYGARPLIVQGAGAGAAVTAMGVLSDLLKL
ncbi:aspartate kinase homoserine dehydrogenase [Pyrrhoderma noxium]|uniref:Homoserine dehydrogenase n=1 Tax=Pyrrhoderma noxium TaxID=2282107 RepID=A0A286U6G5_9AGAM|nr:aspartate kinase homoserine dehydrogenase [Pyrrhoderma noxium]